MKNLYIMYNPYKVETIVKVDGKIPAENSLLNFGKKRLQEWVDDLPKRLVSEINDTEFRVTFEGTQMDYDDIKNSFSSAYKKGIIKYIDIDMKNSSSGESIEIKDKETMVRKLGYKINLSPFKELNNEKIKTAFDVFRNGEFEVSIVGTMSSGKSTMINAFLGKNLMPSRQEACTAIITRIKDNNDQTGKWAADSYDKNGKKLESCYDLTNEEMKKFNGEKKDVAEVRVFGNIPFVSGEDGSLVLVDTPGPNNARNVEHRNTQVNYLNKSSKALIIYIMAIDNYQTIDNKALLEMIAETMQSEGKKSRDRFIFVLNKMDTRTADDRTTEETLESVRNYLKEAGIDEPNIFPVAAKQALQIRTRNELDEDDSDELELKVKRINKREEMHLEKFASLPDSIKEETENELSRTDDVYEKALIHTGIPSVEKAIRQYVLKYARITKITDVIKTVETKVTELDFFEKTKKELAECKDRKNSVLAQINALKSSLSDIAQAKNFSLTVDKTIEDVKKKSEAEMRGVLEKFQLRINEKMSENREKTFTVEQAKTEAENMNLEASVLESEFIADMENIIHINLVSSCERLLAKYRENLEKLAEDIDKNSSVDGIVIDPVKLIFDSVNVDYESITKTETIRAGFKGIQFNSDFSFKKPKTWLPKFIPKIKEKKYITEADLRQSYYAPIQEGLYTNCEQSGRYIDEQSKYISESFKGEFNRLNNILNDKLSVLEKYTNDSNETEREIQLCRKNIKWLEELTADINRIVSI